MAVRTCEECGIKMPFGVRRRPKGDKKVCGGCAIGRPGRPMTNASRTAAAPAPPQFLQDPQTSPPPPQAPEDDEEGAGGPPPPPPAGGGQPPMPGGGLGSFAPDRESDKVVRVCPFCGSGHIVGQSDGSIECGYEGVVFLVEVLPKHPFQPLVDNNGQPFEMTVEGDEQLPEIGVARAEQTAPADQPAPASGGNSTMPAGPSKMPNPQGGDNSGDDDLPPFLRGGSLYVTDEGVAVDEDAYVEHLVRRFS